MTRLALTMLAVIASSSVLAQYDGPAVEACRAYAKREMARDGTKAKDVVIERDQSLSLERYTRKLGTQFVSSILTGNGAVVLENAPSAELGFICLLADEKRAVFFEWLPRANASALAQCTRDGALRDKPRPCLEVLLQVAENDLMQVYAFRFQDARERDDKAKNEAAIAAYRKSNDEWRQYRDAECARRRDYAPEGVAADDYQIACVVDLTRRRALDMR
jgi:uncharacterized protein YecT (DUF1311 family)